MQLSPITVLLGHAGTGKTNAALGLALAEAVAGRQVTLADLDVVNPYFRSSDYPQLLADAGIRLVAPVLARTTLDTPSLTGELDAIIGAIRTNPEQRLIIDVGGDDDGATTIGRWSRMLAEADAQVLYVVSAYRVLTQTPEEAAAMLPAIQDHAHLTANAILNTSNLGDETTMEHVEHGRAFAREVARLCGLPLAATVVPEACIQNSAVPLDEQPFMTSPEEPVLVMPRYVKRPWE